MVKKNKTNGKPKIRWPLNTLPNFQRPGTIPGAKTGKPVVGASGKVYKPYKKPLTRSDLVKPPAPPVPPPVPVLFVTRKTADTIAYLVDNCDIELGWVGAVQQVSEFKYILHDARVMDQEATSATFEYDNWNEAVTEMIVKRTMTAGMVDANLGHSHVNMGVTPSGTDEEQMIDLAHLDDDDKPTAKFSVQTIYNKRGDVHCSIYDWEHGKYYDKCKVVVMSCLSTEDVADLEMQLKRVKEKTYNYAPYQYGTYGGVHGGVMYGSYGSYGRGGKKVDTEQQELFEDGVARSSGNKAIISDNDYITDMELWSDSHWDMWEKGVPIEQIQAKFIEDWDRESETMSGTVK